MGTGGLLMDYWYVSLVLNIVLAAIIAIDHKLADDPRYKSNATFHMLVDFLQGGAQAIKTDIPAPTGIAGIVTKCAEHVVDDVVVSAVESENAGPDKPEPTVTNRTPFVFLDHGGDR